MPELFYYIALSMIEGIGSVTAKNLISYCGGVQEVFAKNKNQLEKIAGIGSVTAARIANHVVFEKAEAEMAFIEKYQIKANLLIEDAYEIICIIETKFDVLIIPYENETNNSETIDVYFNVIE